MGLGVAVGVTVGVGVGVDVGVDVGGGAKVGVGVAVGGTDARASRARCVIRSPRASVSMVAGGVGEGYAARIARTVAGISGVDWFALGVPLLQAVRKMAKKIRPIGI